MVRADVHPQSVAWVMVSSNRDSPTARPTAPTQSTVPAVLRGRVGTTAITAISTTTENAVVNQNTRW